MSKKNIVIVEAKRSAIGNFLGAYSGHTAVEIGANTLEKMLANCSLDKEAIDEVIMGCVLQAGLKQAPARQVTLKAGLSQNTGAMTIHKVCGSGLKAVMLAHDSILAETNNIVVAGGMESMTNAPHLLLTGRSGIKYGHGKIFDHLAYDGLEDAYEAHQPMGVFADKCAAHYNFTRDEQDEYSIASVERAKKAIETGQFKDEIVDFTYSSRKGDVTISTDEKPGTVMIDKIKKLRPAFVKDGTVTAASSSAISDGAATCLVMDEDSAMKHGLKPIARILGHSTNSHKPEWFTTAPVGSIQKLLDKLSLKVSDIDLYEINEAFAVVPMAAMKELGLSHDNVNIFGGAIALGHPIGASGARILVTLINALRKNGGKKGIASLCIGGGEGVSMAIELV